MASPIVRRVQKIDSLDQADANAGTIHDPVWMLTRQWQLGEFQGENASTPVRVEVSTSTRELRWAAEPDLSLADVPPEALIEAESDDWWTLGRRLRIGALIASRLGLDAEQDRWVMASPPPPYDLVPAWDGRAMWQSGELDLTSVRLPEVPPPSASSWRAGQLIYARADAFTADGVSFDVPRHRGGRVDWFSVDATTAGSAPGGVVSPPQVVAPSRLQYPGMPLRGVWEIEERDADIGGYAPDASHTATAIMMSLFFSHRDEWFVIPVSGEAGSSTRIVRIDVTDAFGDTYAAGFDDTGLPYGEPGLLPPAESVATAAGPVSWGLFHTRGLPAGELLLWQTAHRPLEGEVVERVQWGVDDQSNLVWAVERRLDERDPVPAPDDGAASLVPPPPGDHTQGAAYVYIPGVGAAAHWIPLSLIHI